MRKTLISVINEYIEQGIDPVSKEDELWQRFGKQHAILVLDSTGFTRTTNKHGIIHFLSRLAQKRSIALPILEKHGCETYITEADSIIALFGNAQSAIDAVLEINQSLKDEKLMLTDDEPFRICAGIGFGEILVTGEHGDFFGSEVNMASKLGEDSAESGELMLTQGAYDALTPTEQEKYERKETEVSENHIPYYLRMM